MGTIGADDLLSKYRSREALAEAYVRGQVESSRFLRELLVREAGRRLLLASEARGQDECSDASFLRARFDEVRARLERTSDGLDVKIDPHDVAVLLQCGEHVLAHVPDVRLRTGRWMAENASKTRPSGPEPEVVREPCRCFMYCLCPDGEFSKEARRAEIKNLWNDNPPEGWPWAYLLDEEREERERASRDTRASSEGDEVRHGTHRDVPYTIGPRTPFPGIGWRVPGAGAGGRAMESGGAFYDDAEGHPEGAYAWAEASVRRAIDSLPSRVRARLAGSER